MNCLVLVIALLQFLVPVARYLINYVLSHKTCIQWPLSNDNCLVASVHARNVKGYTPLDIMAVIDVSGSMNDHDKHAGK